MKSTWNHFKMEGYNYMRIYSTIQRFKRNGTAEFQKAKKRRTRVFTDKNINRIERQFEKNPSLTIRNCAIKTNIPKSSVFHIKKKILGINGFSKKSAPKYKEGQEKRAKTGCRKIYRNHAREKVIIMDDESYVFADPSEAPGKKYYHAKQRGKVPIAHKFKPKTKFSTKYLVWQAIDEQGHVSEPYISTGTINGRLYKKILKDYLLPFIEKYHNKSDVIFWPDMASSHYCKDVIDWLNENDIKYVPRKDNAPNVPQARPIEKYWAISKKEYSKEKKQPKSKVGFARVWRRVSSKVAEKSAQKLMSTCRRKLRTISNEGVFSTL
jgi:hypothetical protein